MEIGGVKGGDAIEAHGRELMKLAGMTTFTGQPMAGVKLKIRGGP
jgi:hypothetical protein